MADNLKKFLDSAGVSVLWEQIKAKVKTEEDRAKGIEAGLRTDIDAVKADYLKAADKTALEGKITAEAERAAAAEKVNADAIAALDKDLDDGLAAAATALAEAIAGEKSRAEGKEAELAQAIADHEAYVGEFTASEGVDTVVKYIDAKVAGVSNIADGIDGRVSAIEADYLKAVDKTELEGKITAEAERAAGIEAGLRTDVDAIKGDYLKAADRTALEGQIETVANAVEVLTEGVDADKVDGVKDLIDYVEKHGSEVTGMKDDIAKNAEDIAAIEGVIGAEADGENAATGLIGDIAANAAAIAAEQGRAEGKEAELAAAIKAVSDDYLKAADKTELEGKIALKVDQSAYDVKVKALEDADTAIDGRLDAIELMLGDGEGSVADQIEEAKQAAIDAAAADATSKANAAEANAKGHANDLNSAMDARVQALEAIDHDHANKDELDLIVAGDKKKWDDAAAIAHSHENKAILDGITATKIAAWDEAEANAKKYTDDEIAKIQALSRAEIIAAIEAVENPPVQG